jgi:hypothetical protein
MLDQNKLKEAYMDNDDLFYKEREPEKKDSRQSTYEQGNYQQHSDQQDPYGQGYPGGNGYNEYGYPQKKPANGPAIAALVTGLISMCCCFCPYVSLPCAIAGIITAILSRKTGGMNAMAIVGLITSIIGLIIAAFMIIYLVYVMSHPELYQQIMEEYYRMLESMEQSGALLHF